MKSYERAKKATKKNHSATHVTVKKAEEPKKPVTSQTLMQVPGIGHIKHQKYSTQCSIHICVHM